MTERRGNLECLPLSFRLSSLHFKEGISKCLYNIPLHDSQQMKKKSKLVWKKLRKREKIPKVPNRKKKIQSELVNWEIKEEEKEEDKRIKPRK